jgi:hypothetical protein
MSRRRVYTLKTLQLGSKAYNELLDSGKAILKGHEITKVSEILTLLDVKNESTLRGWAKIGKWDEKSVKKRNSNRGRKRVLKVEDEKSLIRYDKFFDNDSDS